MMAFGPRCEPGLPGCAGNWSHVLCPRWRRVFPVEESRAAKSGNCAEGFQTPGSPMAMPAMGGNPNLTAADVRSVLGYLRETFGPR